MRRGFMLALLLAAGCSSQPSAPTETTTTAAAKHGATITLELTVRPNSGTGIARDSNAVGSPCGPLPALDPPAPWDGFVPGSAVVVKDGAGTTLATSKLSAGAVRDAVGADKVFTCQWRIAAEDLPEADFYRIEIAGEEVTTIPLADMKAQDWKATAELQP